MHNTVLQEMGLERWNEYIEKEWIASLDATPFLTKCRMGTVQSAELKMYLAQQYFYSRHFTRYLCALLSNIVKEHDRQELTENLIDESGFGKSTSTPHSILYRQMMTRMGVDPELFPIKKETASLIDTMFESCRNPNVAVGLGALCLGAEAIVPHLYSQVVHGFESNGYKKEDLDFFYLHISCDDEHALTMKKILDSMQSPRDKTAMRASAQRVIAMRTRFFEALVQQYRAPHIETQEYYATV